MASEENGKSPSWKWFLVLVLAVTGWLIVQGVNNINAQIERKVDRSVYEVDKANDRKDIADIKEMVRCIYNWHLPKELRK